MASHNRLGKKGEDAAVNYLVENGFNVIERNWIFGKYEIDIIATKNEHVVFVEVKTRSSSEWGNPEDSVSQSKINRIIEAADYYLKTNDVEESPRFDIIAIILNKNILEINHIEDAFLY